MENDASELLPQSIHMQLPLPCVSLSKQMGFAEPACITKDIYIFYRKMVLDTNKARC